MPSDHHFKLSQAKPSDDTSGGKRIQANVHNFPVLKGMSLYKIILYPLGVREPHWHANADELGYCLKGEVLINIYGTGDDKESFLVEEGDVFFIPSGSLHHLENVGKENAELIVNFSNEDPEDFGISGTFGMFSDAVLGNTWDVKSTIFHNFKRSLTNTFAGLRQKPAAVPEQARYKNPHRFNLKNSEPIISNEDGSARMARQNFWPILQRQALYGLILTGKGMREPHWHPETAELGYVQQGKGRMSILSPSGKVDTYIMEEGDIYFIPAAYPHHIENLQDDDLKIMIFFNQAMPQDIGFTGSVRSYSNEVLAASTNMPPEFFNKLPKYYADSFIVAKINPVDPQPAKKLGIFGL